MHRKRVDKRIQPIHTVYCIALCPECHGVLQTAWVTQQWPLLLSMHTPLGCSKCLLTAAGPCPPARMGHTAVLFDSTLVIFGGRISPAQPLNDVWALDIPSCTWCCIHCKGVAPSARFRHTAVAFGSRLQVCCSVCQHLDLLTAYQCVPSNPSVLATCALSSLTRKPLIITNPQLQTFPITCEQEQETNSDETLTKGHY